MSCGRVEARITIPPSGWEFEVTITSVGGPYTISFSDGSLWYPTELLDELSGELNAISGAGVFTVSVDKTDGSGSGRVTIANASHTFSITGPTEGLYLLGFGPSSMSVAAASFTSAGALRGLWLPDCPIWSRYGAEGGHYDLSRSVSVSPGGRVYALTHGSRRVHPSIRWSHVSRARARIAGETVAGQSFEAWFMDTHGASMTCFGGAPFVRVYSDAASTVADATYQLTTPTSTEMAQAVEGWTGLWPIEIGGYAQ